MQILEKEDMTDGTDLYWSQRSKMIQKDNTDNGDKNIVKMQNIGRRPTGPLVFWSTDPG